MACLKVPKMGVLQLEEVLQLWGDTENRKPVWKGQSVNFITQHADCIALWSHWG